MSHNFDEQSKAEPPAWVEFPPKCIHELFYEQVERTPDAVALAVRDQGREELTYGELNARSNQLAHLLQGLGVGTEVLVGICLERSLEMVVGLLAILKAGGAYVPLDPAYPKERLAFMLKDAQVKVLVTQEQLLSELPAPDGTVVVCLERDWHLIAQEPASPPETRVTPDNLAYVIYTSGSTGQPKGVLGLHRGAVNRFHWMWESYPFEAGEVCCQKTSLSFVDSVWETFGPLLRGVPLVIASDVAAKDPQQLVELLAEEDVTRLVLVPSLLRVLLESFPAPSDVRTSLSHRLPKLKLLVSSGETLPPHLCREFHRLMPNRILLNLYGSSEVSADATWYDTKDFNASSSLTSVPIGRPITNMQVYILDADLQLVPAGSSGELYVGGVGLARGYKGREELSKERFIPNPFRKGNPRDMLYKTGDLGRYTLRVTDGKELGHIEFLGRVDHQVKIRGIRIELGEIEAVLVQHPTVRECVVVAQASPEGRGKEARGDKRLVAYVVSHREALSEGSAGTRDQVEHLPSLWRRLIRQKLPDAFVPSSFVLLDALPLTPNGKVDRRRLPVPTHSRSRLSAAFVPPRTPTEEHITAIWRELLGVEQLGIHDHFFEIGGHSLLATQVITRLRQAFSVELPLHTLFEAPTVASLAEQIEKSRASGLPAPAIQPLPNRNGPLPLSFAQTGLWFLDQLGSGSDYNMSFAWKVSGNLNITALQQSLTEIVRRHETLRTTFLTVNGEPRQVIAPPPAKWRGGEGARGRGHEGPHYWRDSGRRGGVSVPIVDLQALAADEQEAEVARLALEESLRLFDLTKDLMLRVTLLRLGEQEHVLLVTMHHIASDGLSMDIFVDELYNFYDAYSSKSSPFLPELSIQYSDFVSFQRKFLSGERLEKLLSYWKGQLSGAPQQLPLPRLADAPSNVQSRLGDVIPVRLRAESSEKIKQLCQQAGVTLFMGLLTAFKLLLSRYSNQEDIVVGSPIANRNHKQIEPLIGFFVNTLVLRTDLSGNPSFFALLERVRETSIGAYEHQDLPFEQLVETLHPTRELSQNPLFQVMFALQPGADPLPKLSGVRVSRLEFNVSTVRFDLEVDFWEGEAGLEGTFAYRRERFDVGTIQRMVGHLLSLLEGIVANPSQRISDLPMLSEAERHQLLFEWNNRPARSNDFSRLGEGASCIHQLFSEQAERSSDAYAVVAPASPPIMGGRLRGTLGVQRLSYQELNHQANQLAHYLQKKGVGPEALVGISLHTDVRLVVAVLAVLKAGGAYLPLDASYPKERLAFMLKDAQVKLLVTQEQLLSELPAHEAQIICLDRDWHLIAQEPASTPETRVTGENLAYVIYTSGSTGKPKGVMIPHRNLVHAYLAWADAYRLESVHSHLQMASFSFDVFAGNLVRALCSGGKLVLCPREWLLDAEKLSALMQAEQVDCAEFVPAVLRNLILYLEKGGRNPLLGMKLLIVGSDIWYMKEYQQVRRFCGAETRLINSYGVTEATIDSSYFEEPLRKGLGEELGMRALEGHRIVPIGRPFANTQLYILNRYRQPVPIGVAGELHIGGAGLARAYKGRPQLTKEKFIPNPFENRRSLVPRDMLYKTGDLARYLPDGNIEFLGRVDQQVKIRGLRLEVGEIEAVLTEHPDVEQAAVIVWEEEPGEQRLVAYIACNAASTLTSTLRSFLKEKLPAVMIPSTFVLLSALPLTPNGKVDRRTLPAPDLSEREEALVLPRNTVELQLVPIWEKVINRSPIGVQDNFFELGGHSLLAVPLMMTIQQQFGLNLPLATLFQNPTIEEMAMLLRHHTQHHAELWSPLVAIQPNGSQAPFFCVHGIGGNVLNFYQLARYLGTEQPFYGLQAVGLDGKSAPLSTIEAMASCYIEALQVVQPHGPYFLGGHSFGGHIAFEMAQQLLSRRHEVALLALLDSYAPGVDEPITMDEKARPDPESAKEGRDTNWLTNVVTQIEQSFGKQLSLNNETLQGLSFDEQLNLLAKSMERANLLPPKTESEQLRGLVHVHKMNEQMCYIPQLVQPIRLTLLRASEEEERERIIAPTLGWQHFSQEAVEVYIVPGDHFTMLAEPHVQQLAEQLSACLAKARKRAHLK